MTEQAQRKLSSAEVQAIFDRSPFIGWLGLQVVALDHERQEITIRMAMRPELERRPGTRQFHGGPIAAFIDITGDFAIVTRTGAREMLTAVLCRCGHSADKPFCDGAHVRMGFGDPGRLPEGVESVATGRGSTNMISVPIPLMALVRP